MAVQVEPEYARRDPDGTQRAFTGFKQIDYLIKLMLVILDNLNAIAELFHIDRCANMFAAKHGCS